MHKRKYVLSILILATLAVLLGSCITNPMMSYQGKLTDTSGNPVPDGNYNMHFRLWGVDLFLNPVVVWEETQSVAVADGLFNVALGSVTPMTPSIFMQPLELGIEVNGDGEMAPHQPLYGAPYAMTLVDGALMGGTAINIQEASPGMLNVSNLGTGYGVAIQSYGKAGVGVDGVDTGEYGFAADNVEYGAVFTSTVIGLKVTMESAGGGHGILAWSDSTGGGDWAIFGDTNTAGGILGRSTGDGIYAVRGSNSNGLGGYFYNSNDTYYSLHAYNAHGTDAPGLRVFGTSYFDGAKTGYVADLCRAAEDLEPGDVVVVAGFEPAILGEVPVIVVRKATQDNATGVVGVVDARQIVTPADEELLNDPTANRSPVAEVRYAPGPIRAGDYLLVVTLGAYKGIKVDATAGPIRPGDLLTASPNSGHAVKAQPITVDGVSFYAPGTIIGTAMDSLDAGTGLIPVFVSAR